jgi:hypothetical protein
MTGRPCSVRGCRAPHYGRGYCRPHWARWRRTGDPLGRRRAARRCVVSGCDRPHHGRGYCRTHWSRVHRWGDPRAHRPIAERAERPPSYRVVCQRLRAVRGPAEAHPCWSCGTLAAVWSYNGTDPAALRHGRAFSTDLTRYRAACRTCHRHPFDPDRAARLYRAGASLRGIAALLGVGTGTVRRTLRARDIPTRTSGRTDLPTSSTSG